MAGASACRGPHVRHARAGRRLDPRGQPQATRANNPSRPRPSSTPFSAQVGVGRAPAVPGLLWPSKPLLLSSLPGLLAAARDRRVLLGTGQRVQCKSACRAAPSRAGRGARFRGRAEPSRGFFSHRRSRAAVQSPAEPPGGRRGARPGTPSQRGTAAGQPGLAATIQASHRYKRRRFRPDSGAAGCGRGFLPTGRQV